MKTTLITLSLLLSFTSFAKDMSDTENYKEAYQDQEDGSSVYVGGCSVHQDYEGKMFTEGQVLVKYFEPMDLPSKKEIAKRLAKVEKELLKVAGEGNVEGLYGADDITIDRINHKKIKGLDLYRLNIGVGGGNGYYEVYNRTEKNGKPNYEKMSHVFDGDMEFCDSKVWIKK